MNGERRLYQATSISICSRTSSFQAPFFRTNESRLQWISDSSWEYRTKVDIPAFIASQEHIELVFEGLDAYAHVFLNGQEILTANNMFRTWRVDVKPLLHSGTNELEVNFPPPDKAAQEQAQKDPWFSRTHVEAKTYVRKAAYEYGWDWGPTFVTSGIWRPVHIEAWKDARITNLYLKQADVSAAVAHVLARVEVEASGSEEATLNVDVNPPGTPGERQTISQRVQLHAGKSVLDIPVQVQSPKLWWPAGYGNQDIYAFSVKLLLGTTVQDTRTATAGLRTVKLRRDRDASGRSFEFVVNGIPVFAKGADVIPFDSFPSRVTTAKYRDILQSAKDANMNMIRLWGGGYYETDEFYNICDELGLMIWHDFMFGNDWQPGTYEFKLNVEQEATDQLRRLRNHPSIVLWSGNNETELAFHWKDRDKLDSGTRMQMWQDYLSLFHGVLARTVAALDPEVPYWPSSPSADLEEVSETFRSGDEHIWDVWHGRVPFATYEQHHPRFVSEYGFQSFPEIGTVNTFTLPKDRTSIFNEVMLAHQKNNEGNSLIHDYMLRDYPPAKDFPAFLYMSQVLQAEGIKLGAEHFRRERDRTMGSMYWQLNDCWPVASWSSIDSLGRWKALQFYARRFYAPVLASPSVEDGKLRVYVVSDRTASKTGELTVAVRRFDGTPVLEKTMQVVASPQASRIAFEIPLTEIAKGAQGGLAHLFVAVTLLVTGEESSRNLRYLVPTKEIELPKPHLQTLFLTGSEGIQLQVHSDVLARSVYLSTGEVDSEFGDNYFDLLPGETRKIPVRSTTSIDVLRDRLQVMSVGDAVSTHRQEPAVDQPAF